MLGREPTPIPFSTEALRASLLRLQNEWETFQSSHARDLVIEYLTAVFELVSWWAQEGTAVTVLIGRCSCEGILRSGSRKPSPPSFVARLIRQRLMSRTRSKWSRVLRYAAEFKDLDQPLRDFIKRKGGINKCASRFARRWTLQTTAAILFGRDESVLCTRSIDSQTTTHRQNAQR